MSSLCVTQKKIQKLTIGKMKISRLLEVVRNIRRYNCYQLKLNHNICNDNYADYFILKKMLFYKYIEIQKTEQT